LQGKPSQIRGVRKAAAPEISQDPTLVGFVAAAAGDEGAACDVAMAAVTFETLVATLPHDRSLGCVPVFIAIVNSSTYLLTIADHYSQVLCWPGLAHQLKGTGAKEHPKDKE